MLTDTYQAQIKGKQSCEMRKQSCQMQVRKHLGALLHTKRRLLSMQDVNEATDTTLSWTIALWFSFMEQRVNV